MLRVESVNKNSPAEKAGIRAGDNILSANGRPIRDALDLLYYIENERRCELVISRFGVSVETVLQNPRLVGSGIEPEQLKIRRCGNKCVFCFIDQQPSGLRPSLYIKDEDVRFSFIHGNFVTLTNTPEWEFERIIEQKMSPLYISVHSTDETIRRKLLNNCKITPMLPTLRRLTSAGIEIHSQVVVVPGYNSSEAALRKTILELYDLGKCSVSCALVPVGLTKYRDNLTTIEPVNQEITKQIIELTNSIRDSLDRPEFLQIADEFFVLGNEDFPMAAYYGDFPQLENGVGMMRLFIDDALNISSEMNNINALKDIKIDIVTGVAAYPVFCNLIYKIFGLKENNVRIIKVNNRFWGEGVTVANLLTGNDIAESLKNSDADLIFIPPNVLNNNNLFLDDLSFDELQSQTVGKIYTNIAYLSEVYNVINDHLENKSD